MNLDLFGDEEREKRRILAAHQRRRKVWLATIRQELERIYAERARLGAPNAFVTANDARVVFEALPGVPPASEVSRSFLGAVFHAPGWVPCGLDRSRVVGHHACLLLRWRRDA